uniref:Uncharacterized protein n=1 Tax=Arundo donax TaxID=35708 RepID=A0A0A9GAJ4_ARUDO
MLHRFNDAIVGIHCGIDHTLQADHPENNQHQQLIKRTALSTAIEQR